MKKTETRGRKPLPPAEKKNRPFTMKFRKAEFQKIRKLADAEGRSVADFITRRALGL